MGAINDASSGIRWPFINFFFCFLYEKIYNSVKMESAK